MAVSVERPGLSGQRQQARPCLPVPHRLVVKTHDYLGFVLARRSFVCRTCAKAYGPWRALTASTALYQSRPCKPSPVCLKTPPIAVTTPLWFGHLGPILWFTAATGFFVASTSRTNTNKLLGSISSVRTESLHLHVNLHPALLFSPFPLLTHLQRARILVLDGGILWILSLGQSISSPPTLDFQTLFTPQPGLSITQPSAMAIRSAAVAALAVTSVVANALSLDTRDDSCPNKLKVDYTPPVAAKGWNYRLAANGLKKPRSIAFDDNNGLLVVDSGVGVYRLTIDQDNGDTCVVMSSPKKIIDSTQVRMRHVSIVCLQL